MTIEKQKFMEAYRFRRSTRRYDPAKKISREDMEFILELGRQSPSSVGSEPWRFLVIQNEELRNKIKHIAWGMAAQLDDCSHLVVLLARKNLRYDSPAMRESMLRRGLDETGIAKALPIYEKFQRNDMKLLENNRTLFDWCCKQTYIALANMMTGAAVIGISSCPIEGFDYEELNRILAEAGAFDPAEYGVAVATTFGYRSEDIAAKARRDFDDVVKWLD